MITTFANAAAPIMTTGDFVFKTDVERVGTKNNVGACVGLKNIENVRQDLSTIQSTPASKYPAAAAISMACYTPHAVGCRIWNVYI